MGELLYSGSYHVTKNNYAAAGEVSANIKQILKKIGIPADIIRRISIAAYEAELNMVIHSFGGDITLLISPERVTIYCKDTGPGIADISLAMKEGYSTASEDVRMMGFGAGMGLPNINRNSDDFHITSDKNGTELTMKFNM
jgi:anti-sigma regulatory factor (Ser/Thr protein kinase)